jgi:hypothetical protein
MFRLCLRDSAATIAGRIGSRQQQSVFAVPTLGEALTSYDPHDAAVFRSISGEEVSCRLTVAKGEGDAGGGGLCYQLVEGTALEAHRSQLKALAIATEVCCSVLQVDE